MNYGYKQSRHHIGPNRGGSGVSLLPLPPFSLFHLFVIKPQLFADESHSWHLDTMHGWGSDTILSLPPNNDERHPAGFDTSIHENGHNPTPAPDPASFAIFYTPFLILRRSLSGLTMDYMVSV